MAQNINFIHNIPFDQSSFDKNDISDDTYSTHVQGKFMNKAKFIRSIIQIESIIFNFTIAIYSSATGNVVDFQRLFFSRFLSSFLSFFAFLFFVLIA